MYFTDRGIEELVERRGDEQLSVEWLGGRLQQFGGPLTLHNLLRKT